MVKKVVNLLTLVGKIYIVVFAELCGIRFWQPKWLGLMVRVRMPPKVGHVETNNATQCQGAPSENQGIVVLGEKAPML